MTQSVASGRRLASAWLMLAIAASGLVTSKVMGLSLHPAPLSPSATVIERVPQQFGAWRVVGDSTVPVNPARPDALGKPGQLYDAMVSRTYAASDGTRVMLMLAYQRRQFQEDRIHSPELCYYAQGFVVLGKHYIGIPLAGMTVPGRAFTGVSLSRQEDVVFWIRTGHELRPDSLSTRLEIMRAALHSRIDDGILVRASMTDNFGPSRSSAEKQQILAGFLRQLVAASPSGTRTALLGGPTA